ncbi:hypothetical protein SEMRO_378_G130340.1 [Seminavis robusta]|uniref:Uncharacterized protein n=1 Tax=Seminavis robusta TaxID=568900 RepID=A0A9N8DVP9_9STRA|nr:hypothetical protein SEMRO_378_G130340.1 [Seminavis robusta]|eukprot:Sro378_g130340.1 n/a (185) ;mRNA; f:52921-53475
MTRQPTPTNNSGVLLRATLSDKLHELSSSVGDLLRSRQQEQLNHALILSSIEDLKSGQSDVAQAVRDLQTQVAQLTTLVQQSNLRVSRSPAPSPRRSPRRQLQQQQEQPPPVPTPPPPPPPPPVILHADFHSFHLLELDPTMTQLEEENEIENAKLLTSYWLFTNTMTSTIYGSMCNFALWPTS